MAFGALLPDLIDRPIGNILFRERFDANDHLFAHTIWFSLALLVLGLALLRWRADTRLLGVAAGALTHLAVDPVTHAPETLFWPLLGTDFPQVALLGTRATIATETVAALIIAAVLVRLARLDRLRLLMFEGRL